MIFYIFFFLQSYNIDRVPVLRRCISIQNKNKKCLDPLRQSKRPCHGFGYLSLISDPIRSGKRRHRKILKLAFYNAVVSRLINS